MVCVELVAKHKVMNDILLMPMKICIKGELTRQNHFFAHNVVLYVENEYDIRFSFLQLLLMKNAITHHFGNPDNSADSRYHS